MWKASGNALRLDVGDRGGIAMDLRDGNFQVYNVTSASVFLDVASSGNVGIGTASPDTTLSVKGSAGAMQAIFGQDLTTGVNYVVIGESNTADKGLALAYDRDNNVGHLIITGEASWGTALSIANGGKVGIGTSSPASKLSVGGSGPTTAGVYGLATWYGVYGESTSGYWGVYGKSTGTGVKGEGNSGGVQGDGGTCDFDAIGVGTNYCASSSIMMKDNVVNFTGGLGKIIQLRPVSFTWKDSEKKDVGLISEEVSLIIPEVVNSEKTAIDYGALSPFLAGAIQEQQSIIESQNDTINSQQFEIELLKSQLQELCKKDETYSWCE